MRAFLMKRCRDAGAAGVEIERDVHAVTIKLTVAKPGVIIGRGGSGVEDIKKELQKMFFAKSVDAAPTAIKITVSEVDHPALCAQVVASQVAQDIERRVAFRRSMKQALDRIMKAGAEGAKMSIGGRLGGAEIARTEKIAQGKIPLHTLRADIDYAQVVANTTYGTIGIKVWIYKGEIFNDAKEQSNKVTPLRQGFDGQADQQKT